MSTRVRLQPETRREQLLELGVRLFSTRTLEQMSIDVLAEAAGISRGLLYHYFGNKTDFHEAVVRRAVQDLVDVTAPVDHPDLLVRMTVSLERYVGYVVDNHTAYVSIVRAANSGNATMREIYETARNALVDRIFESAAPEELAAVGLADTPRVRLMTRGWAALVEEVVLAWLADDRGLTRDELIETLALALPAVTAPVPR
jgi:AcrR family transcriptional regulator